MSKFKSLKPRHRKKIEEILKEIHGNFDILYEIAMKDEKTGLHNMKFFDSIFDIEFEQARRGQKLSLAVIDIDYFKKVNDLYGHLKGDEILLRVARVIKSSLRKSDVVSRFGGEEFFVLLLGTDKKRAKQALERVRKSIETNKTLKKYNVTISAGTTQFKKQDTKKQLQKRADKAMYKAKAQGRNKVVVG